MNDTTAAALLVLLAACEPVVVEEQPRVKTYSELVGVQECRGLESERWECMRGQE